MYLRASLAALVLLTLAACGPDGGDQKPQAAATPQPAAAPDDPAARLAKAADIDGDRIIHADNDPGNWLAHGRTYGEQRFSPLKDINRDTVKNLGVAWEFRTN